MSSRRSKGEREAKENELGAPRAEERKKKKKKNQRPTHHREATTTQHEGGKRGKRSMHREETSIERTPIISFRRKREVKQEVLSLLSSLFDVFASGMSGTFIHSVEINDEVFLCLLFGDQKLDSSLPLVCLLRVSMPSNFLTAN